MQAATAVLGDRRAWLRLRYGQKTGKSDTEPPGARQELARPDRLTSVAIVDTKKVSNDLILAVLHVEDSTMRVFHADSPALHLGDSVQDGVIAAGRRGLLRDGLRECLTHLVVVEQLSRTVRCSVRIGIEGMDNRRLGRRCEAFQCAT